MSIGLNDYTFRLNDAGVTLNTDATLPFVDIDNVVGLDSAPYRETIRDHEGTDGSFIDAEFEKGRDVILNGTIYANTSNVEAYLDSLKANYAPVTNPIPLYLKAPGLAERVIFVKPRGIRYNWQSARRIGITSAQFLAYAEDPRIYDSTLQSIVVPYGGSAGNGFGFTTLLDTFTRTTSNGWGTADSGHTYTLTGTAADFDTNGTTGRITLTAATGTAYYALSSLSAVRNHQAFVQGLTLSATPTGGTISKYLDMLYIDANNFYRVEIIFTTGDAVQVALIKLVAGVPTTLVSATTVGGLTHASLINVRAEVENGQSGNGPNMIRAKVYAQGTAEPAVWTVEVGDSALTSNGQTRVGAVRNTGNTNTNPIMSWDSFQSWQGFGFSLDFGGGATPAGANVTNAGNRSTPAVMTIQGPIDNPLIANDTTGSVLNFIISLGASDTLTVDLLNRTVVLNGTANRRSTLTTPSWFFINSGINFIRFGGTNGTGSQLTIAFRSAWR